MKAITSLSVNSPSVAIPILIVQLDVILIVYRQGLIMQ